MRKEDSLRRRGGGVKYNTIPETSDNVNSIDNGKDLPKDYKPSDLKSNLIILAFVFIHLASLILATNFLVLPKTRPAEWDQWYKEFTSDLKDNSTYSIPEEKYSYTYSKAILTENPNFDSDLAYNHLLRLGSVPHSYNSKEVLKVEKYLLDYFQAIQQLSIDLTGKNRVAIHIQDETNIISTEGFNKLVIPMFMHPAYFQSYNIVVRVLADDEADAPLGVLSNLNEFSSKHKALLLSAHYDSQSTSKGASDDGISVAVLLETLRNSVISTPKSADLIFNFNNGEEKGLVGSKTFLEHQWFKDCISFINLEASGTGNRAMLFQSTSKTLSKAFADGPNSHINIIAYTAFKLKLLNSRTDFQVYNEFIPGVDFALYSNRAFYHSYQDDIDKIYQPSLIKFGESILYATRALTSIEQKLGDKIEFDDGGVFFDIFGKGFCIEFNLYLAGCLFLGVLQILHLILLCNKLKEFLNSSNNSIQKRPIIWIIFRCFMSLLLATVLFIALSNVTNALWVSGSGMAAHSFSNGIFIAYTMQGLAIMGLIYYFYLWFEGLDYNQGEAVYLLSTHLFWTLLNFVNCYLLYRGLGPLYFLSIFSLFHYVAVQYNVESILKNSQAYHRFAVSIITSFAITLILYELSIASFFGLSQSIPTGTKSALVYYFIAFFGFINTLNALPLVPMLFCTNPLKKIGSIFMLSVALSFITYSKFPVLEKSPLVYHIGQNWCISPELGCQFMKNNYDPFNLDNNDLHYVRVFSSAFMEEVINSVPSAKKYDSKFAGHYRTFNNYYYYGPKPAFPIKDQEILNTTLISSLHQGSSQYKVKIHLDGFESRDCAISFLQNNVTSVSISTSPHTDVKIINNYNGIPLMLNRRDINTPFEIEFDLHLDKDQTKKIRLGTTCGYDEIEYIPAIKELNENLPKWALVTTPRSSILRVYKDFELKL